MAIVPPLASSLSLFSPARCLSSSSPKLPVETSVPLHQWRSKLGRFLRWKAPTLRVSASENVDSLAAESSIPLGQSPQQIVPAADGGASSIIISALLFIAFIGLFIVTIGVIYLAVQDFLQKREREKFEKEEAEKRKKGGKKKNAGARAGPRGFGQKIEEDED
ncbi:hypothetical protein AXF42_Ash014914 [Apostasia shenzhenica]|uniref:Uncharacterized protein n=1 Tax=Apostasia shenzhenica TaxID=1088818 RepID=A0A2I0ALH7_9ASPA|nr:hypothetical protein AXF42_Ash014914 [Apostasia shenzhenica]